MKKIIIILAVLWVGFAFMGYLFWGGAKEKIAKAEQDLKEFRTKFTAIKKTSDSLDTIVASLNVQRVEYRTQVDSLYEVIDMLENLRQDDIIRVAQLFQPDDIVDEVRETFPKFKRAPMGVAVVPHPRTGLPITTFQMPIQLVSSFIADRNDVVNLLKQKEVFKIVNLTLEDVIALQDSIITLKEQKVMAYKEGLEFGMNKYEQLTKEYINTLKNPPKVSLFPNKFALVGIAAGAAVGYAVGK